MRGGGHRRKVVSHGRHPADIAVSQRIDDVEASGPFLHLTEDGIGVKALLGEHVEELCEYE